MTVVWEGMEIPGQAVVDEADASPRSGQQFRSQFRVVLAEAALRVAEADLNWHREQKHYVRSFIARQRVAKRRKDIALAAELDAAPAHVAEAEAVVVEAPAEQKARAKGREPVSEAETGDRVVTYLRLGVRNVRNVQRA